jgi:hypothetical protein
MNAVDPHHARRVFRIAALLALGWCHDTMAGGR